MEKDEGSQRREVESLEVEMRNVHDSWKIALLAVIETISQSFSESFSSIKCAGEVRLLENDDYSKWGIEIMVKFRDSESLQVLTGQRQSGGERSVSTMLYLIALQSLTTSPLRVVDEINQGMDPRNERLIHKLIVKAACVGAISQYFLITPKLLPDLEFHQNMEVLCILNGVWQPDKFSLENDQASKRQRIST